MKHLNYALLIIFSFFLSVNCVFGADIKQLNVASEEWENNTNKDGTGLYWEIIRKVYEIDNIKLKIKIVPYARSVHMVKTQKVDAWVASYIDEEPFPIYPKWHFDADVVSALFKKNKFPEWKGVKSLVNKKVGWIRGYDYNEYIDVKMTIDELSSRKSAFGVLLKDRIDVFLDALVEIKNELSKKDYLNKIGFHINDYRVEKLLQLNLYLAFAKNDRGKQLSKIWDKNFPVLLKNGTIKKLFDKYQMNVFPFDTIK